MTINERMKQIASTQYDDEDEYTFEQKSSKKMKNESTIMDLLNNGGFTRDFKITSLDEKLTSLFSHYKLKGDEVTFIGSTFMKYGEKEPYFNHCVVVGSCDDVAGTTIDVCQNEKELL